MTFRFNTQYTPQDTSWAGLSESVAKGFGAVKSLQDMETDENKAHEQHQRDMNQLLGMKDKGLLSGEQYNSILDEANADAQKNGAIKAYENFTMFDSLDKERAELRLASWDEYMHRNIDKLSDVQTLTL